MDERLENFLILQVHTGANGHGAPINSYDRIFHSNPGRWSRERFLRKYNSFGIISFAFSHAECTRVGESTIL